MRKQIRKKPEDHTVTKKEPGRHGAAPPKKIIFLDTLAGT